MHAHFCDVVRDNELAQFRDVVRDDESAQFCEGFELLFLQYQFNFIGLTSLDTILIRLTSLDTV